MRPITGSSGRILALVCPSALCGPASAQFTEEAILRGVDYLVAPSGNSGAGIALCDLDRDRDFDLVVLGRLDGVIGVYENDGSGYFTDRSASSGLAPLPLGTASGVVAVDYDGDGRVDLFFSNADVPNRLVRNVGGFQFVDVTAAAGLGDWGWGSGCAWGDYDGDGDLDLHLANKTTLANMRPSLLYRNNGDGSFTVDEGSGLDNQDLATWQSIFLDYDLDGDVDLYISNDKGQVGTRQRNYLWQNVGGTFVDVTEATGTAAFIDSMGVAVGDMDGNGYPDLYCTNIGPNPLFLNNGTTFVDASVIAGVTSDSVGWGALFFDFDLDRKLDLHVCNSADYDRLYSRTGGFPCEDRARELHLDHPFLSYCTAVGDIDGDGDSDLVHSAEVAGIRIFVNGQQGHRHWSKIQLVGRTPNTKAVGARVEITSAGGKQSQHVLAGVGYKSSSPFTLHFGLGDDIRITELEVRWPGGQITRAFDLPVDQRIVVRQTTVPGANAVNQ